MTRGLPFWADSRTFGPLIQSSQFLFQIIDRIYGPITRLLIFCVPFRGPGTHGGAFAGPRKQRLPGSVRLSDCSMVDSQ